MNSVLLQCIMTLNNEQVLSIMVLMDLIFKVFHFQFIEI